MPMDRRTLVKVMAGATATGALAGCVSTEDPGENGDDSDDAGGDDDGNGYEEDEDWPTVEPDGVSGEAELWYELQEGEAAAFTSHVDNFNDSYDVTITADEVAELQDQTTAAIPAGDGAELFMWAHDWIGEYYENGFLSDQSDTLSIDPEEYFGENADSARYDGATLGLPFAAETVSLIYNEDYVDEVPDTFEEVLEIADEHHDPDAGTYGFAWPMDAYHVSAMPYGFGGYYYDDDSGELGLTEDGTVEGFEYIIDNVWEYMAQDPDGEAQQSVFLEGNSPFIVSGPWLLGDLDFDYGVAPWPDADGNTPSPFTGVQLFYYTAAMDDDEERAEAAVAFTEWYTTNTSIITQMAEEHGYIPVHNAFADDGEEQDELSAELQGFSAAVDQGQPMATAPEFGDVWEPLEDEWLEALNGNKSVADAMADAENQIQSAWD
ncbi:sugar ABC transporter substrate-binding protein [Natrononativus amylolyticus]|uniref:sugar ABC transporter substrate-binding protein n=1 Tax=Natrononativus amylolyticus TaxID=2963434 RepID=UPI0020CC57E7|nr:sugar ABC transporter substrate-binding protein [Natrononativus amylolyticus]